MTHDIGAASPFEHVLDQRLAELDAAHEAARLSAPPFDDTEILDLLEPTVQQCAAALLDVLGESRDGRESAPALVDLLVEAIPKNPDRFSEGAPIVVLEREAAGLRQVLRDVGYLRQGMGLAKSGSKPTDMKWDHASTAESYLRTAFRRIASELRAEGADIQRPIPEADIDLASTRLGITKLLEQDLGSSDFMDDVIELGRSKTHVAGWDAYRDIPYEQELDERSSFFLEVLEREPPANPLTGFGVEIAYPSHDGETTADLWLMGGSAYQPNDETWLDVQEYTPRHHAAHSDVLAAIYRLAYAPGGLGNAADYTLCLAWGAYFSRACAYRYLVETALERIGLRVGFGGGAEIDMGWVQAEG